MADTGNIDNSMSGTPAPGSQEMDTVDDTITRDGSRAASAEIEDDLLGDDIRAASKKVEDDLNGDDFQAAPAEVEDNFRAVSAEVEDDFNSDSIGLPLTGADDNMTDGDSQAAQEEADDTNLYTENDLEDIRQSVEDDVQLEPSDLLELFEDPEDPDTVSNGSQEVSGAPSVHMEDEDHDNHSPNYYREDSQTLFVPEHEESPPPARQLRPFAKTADPSRPLVPPQSAGTSTSTAGAMLRNMYRNYHEKKQAARRLATRHLSNIAPDDETYLEAILPEPSAPVEATEAYDYDAADEQANKEYQKQKRYYLDLKQKNGGKLSFRHDVEWMKIQGAENARRKKQQRDVAKTREAENEGEPDLFPTILGGANDDPDNESNDAFEADGSGSRKRRRREMPDKEPPRMSMQDAELKSMQVALEAEGDNPRKKKKGKASEHTSPAAGSGKGRGPKSKAAKGPKTKAAPKKATKSDGIRKAAKKKREVDLAIKQATSLFSSNVFQQQAGANASEQPVFRSRVKADALKELIASVPVGDQKAAKGDMNVLLAATRDFDGRGAVKSDGGGLWLVKGMRTSLKNYQVLGTAFMRRRENATEEPKGGLMADQMGLGKTLMMLANIVNGQPPKGDKGPRTTLLVASPALLTQWKSEIEQHAACKFKIMRYGSGTRIDSNEAAGILGQHDIILTTYNEIMKSYPKNEPPIECQTAEQKIAWWREVYEKNRGVLHRMMFLRVVLDEAQSIKNHMARTSIACRALMARHKWALSGTPILNGLSELYPYFKFLGVPHTGSFKIFKHNYCDSKDAENTERLLVRLSQFMIRRTHADMMFGAPILKLPQADQITYDCEFNTVERTVYDIVRNRFARRINMLAQKGELEASYSNALVMLLRLRQLTAHVLMLQFVMRDLLEREDIERIKEVVEDQTGDSNSRRGQTIKAIRKQLDKFAVDQKKKSIALAIAKKAAHRRGEDFSEKDFEMPEGEEEEEYQNEIEDEEPIPEPTEQAIGGQGVSGGTFGKEYNFKPYLASLRTGESWEKAKARAKCSYCGGRPRTPFILSCKHLICSEPCHELAVMEAAEQERQNIACKTCGITSLYVGECEYEDGDSPEQIARGTRSQKLKQKEKVRKRQEGEDIREDWLASLGDDVLPSAKTIAVKAQIINWTKENPNVKVIVYTQFLAVIRILARVCHVEGWQAEQYHGKMSFKARDKAIEAFTNNPKARVMLASLRCGGLGLNLTMASKVIMIDPWWNSASEQQAFCRVFRIGQKEETFMSRLCVKNTVDQRLIEMQEKKQREIDAVMEDGGKTAERLSIRDIMRLFGNLEEDAEGKPFIMVDNPDPRGGFRADRDDEGYADEM